MLATEFKPHVLSAEEEDANTPDRGSSISANKDVIRKKALQKWKEGIEVSISFP